MVFINKYVWYSVEYRICLLVLEEPTYRDVLIVYWSFWFLPI
jgi:hypothetical protein